MTTLVIHVHGVAAPQGSKRHVGRGVMVESSKRLRPWRDTVTQAALDALGDRPAFTGPVELHVTFTFARPKYHYRTGARAGELRANAPAYVAVRPDSSKLVRAVEDALTDAGVWRDDAQVAIAHTLKVYGQRPGAHIVIRDLA